MKIQEKTISQFNPDLIINAAAKVGGIYANDTQGTAFLIENLKININILESIIDSPNISLINLEVVVFIPLNAANPINEDSFMGGVLRTNKFSLCNGKTYCHRAW